MSQNIILKKWSTPSKNNAQISQFIGCIKEVGELSMARELPTLKQNVISVFNDPPCTSCFLHNIS